VSCDSGTGRANDGGFGDLFAISSPSVLPDLVLRGLEGVCFRFEINATKPEDNIRRCVESGRLNDNNGGNQQRICDRLVPDKPNRSVAELDHVRLNGW
jgi:hypothetical protein